MVAQTDVLRRELENGIRNQGRDISSSKLALGF